MAPRPSTTARRSCACCPSAGGEPRRLTDLPLGAGTPAWSPDSARLAFSARVPQEGRYGTGKTEDGETIGADGEAPRRITRYFYRVDGLGFLLDRPAHLFVTDLDGTLTQVTDGERSHGDPEWSPDGRSLAFVSERHDTWGDDLASDVCVMPAGGGEIRALTDTTFSLGCAGGRRTAGRCCSPPTRGRRAGSTR